MNKTAIKNFAVAARLTLIDAVTQRAYEYEVTENGKNNPDQAEVNGKALTQTERSQRRQLIDRIRLNGFAQTMEEAAYTWFNRFIALRFMEVNGYLPTRIRVFTDENNAFKPEILAEASRLDFDGIDHDYIMELLDTQENDKLYKYLLIAQCNALNCGLPEMFEEIGGWTELLFPNNLLRNDSVIAHMVEDIPEDDWRDQVQIIGWLYQYYNTEPKDKVFADLKKNIKISAEAIPAATQLFTPDWIVRYMVENSLGRLWTEGHGKPENADWKYYLEEAEQEDSVKADLEKLRAEYKSIQPEQIKIIDPCMGSGHILVYAFDVLMDIYTSCGWSERDAALSILQHNLFGLDIDRRAYQLAYFAVMMKARQYNRSIIKNGEVQPNLANFADVMGVDTSFVSGRIREFAEQFRFADTYGSLMKVTAPDGLDGAVSEFNVSFGISRRQLDMMLRIYKNLSQKYDVVVTNPPYMGGSGMNATLSEYVKSFFPDSKSDLFACFIEKCGQLAKPHGFYAMITQHAWMFLSSYENLRKKLMLKTTIDMAHLGARAFDEIGGEVVQTTAFVECGRRISDFAGKYVRLVDIVGENEKRELFLSGEKRYAAKQENFSKIPGMPVAYWVSEAFVRAFENPKLQEIAKPRVGLQTGDNNRFLKLWFECNHTDIFFDCENSEESRLCKKKWYPHNKGGSYRKWYGNHEYIINYQFNGNMLGTLKGASKIPDEIAFGEAITYSRITSNEISFRKQIKGFIFDSASVCSFPDIATFNYLLGLLNTKVSSIIVRLIAPTINTQPGDIAKLPIIFEEQKRFMVGSIVKKNIEMSKQDWDSFETSWDFEQHPLICGTSSIKEAYKKWEQECTARFNKLKANEEELNRIFIEIYGLQDELTPEVEDKDVTVRRADLTREIKSLISYAIGSIFGRYSVDTKGICYAGGDWDSSKYKTIIPDKDNVVPICDDDYFEDDLTARIIDFVAKVYGADTLEENLKFIADALNCKGTTPREVIRNYLLTGFYADHCKIYQKRPIYWLFSSGKKHGFKALVYMHRWKKTTVATVRTDYVHELQERYRTQLSLLADQMQSAAASDRVKLKKRQEKLTAQLTEINAYEEKVHHLADMMIDIDLDDGVKVNYAKFADILEKIK